MNSRVVYGLPCWIWREIIMAKKSRYLEYTKGYQKLRRGQKRENRSTTKSVLQKLKDLKNQEFSMTVPIGDANGQ